MLTCKRASIGSPLRHWHPTLNQAAAADVPSGGSPLSMCKRHILLLRLEETQTRGLGPVRSHAPLTYSVSPPSVICAMKPKG